MRTLGKLIAMLAVLALALPLVPAQEKDKKDADKKDKAVDKKKDDEKKDKADDKKAKDDDKKKDADAKDKKKDKADDKKAKDDDEPKDKKKTAEKKKDEDKVEYGQVLTTKIISMRPDSSRDFTIELPQRDPMKVAEANQWIAQQMAHVAQAPNPQEYAQRMATFQQQLAQKVATGLTTMKPIDVRAVDKVKVRTLFPPVQYDDTGNLKKWTVKELTTLKGTSKLPGYPAEIEVLKPGQVVYLYLAKPPAPPKGSTAEKKKNDIKKKLIEDDEKIEMTERPEVVMIIVAQEPMGR